MTVCTQALVEPLTDPRQDSQSYEVTEAGSDGRSYVVWVDARLLGAHDNAHHDDTWQNTETMQSQSPTQVSVQFYCV